MPDRAELVVPDEAVPDERLVVVRLAAGGYHSNRWAITVTRAWCRVVERG